MLDKKNLRSFVFSWIILLLTLFFFAGSAAAVNISASATVVYTGQRVNFTVTSTHTPSFIGPNCTLEVLFGDGSSSTLPVCNSLSCTASTSHVYSRAGTYRATARPLSGCANLNPPTSDSVTITVRDRARLTVTISPARIDYDITHPAPINLTYNGRSSVPINDTLTSTRGIFRAGSTVLGRISTTLSAPLTRGTARFNETLTIPATVIDQAQKLGVDLIRFERTFSSSSMDPASASTEISITFAPREVTLPDGVVGLDYSYQLGNAGNSYTLVQGQLDPGLKVVGNYLRGVPQREAGYRFQLRETAGGRVSLIWYNLKINRARLTVTISPAHIDYDAARPAPINLTYSGRSSAPLNDTLTSNEGIFRAGSTVIGSIPTALSAPLTRGTARFNETLTIPAAVIDRARQLGINLIQFERGFSSNFMAPANGQTEISLTFAPTEITLPDGFTGVSYSYRLGDPGSRYQLVSGQMPPGLKLEGNLIKGIPEREGGYRFQIEENRLRKIKTWYNLQISKSRLLVTTSPSQVTVSRNKPDAFKLTYTFKSAAGLEDTLSSAAGIFSANGTEIGHINQPLSTRMSAGRARIEETVSIPLAVLKAAERQGIDRLSYQRTFTARYLDATTTGVTAITVGTGFTFTKIKLYFDDKTSKKFVKRNARGIGAQVELRYEGAGVLKGYWQADNRILSQVTMDLPFAKSRTITLTLPETPPLPTFAQGSHRLRFVITEPPMDIAFPQIIYIVSGEDLSHLHPIQLLTPADRETLPAATGLSFSWKAKSGIAVYKLEIFSADANPESPPEETKTLFSAYCKKPVYTVPEIIRQNKLSTPGTYFWLVTGYDNDNQPVARSSKRSFSLKGETSLDHVPKRLLLTFDSPNADDKNIQARLERLTSQYHLRLESRKKLARLGLELVIFSTPDKVADSQRRIKTGMPDANLQPDYYYATFGTVAETHNLDKIRRQLRPLKPLGNGDGIRIAVIDTGVDLDLEELAGNLIAHANYVEHSPYRAEIHGTAVASIIAARQDHQGCAGIAPQSKLIALRACSQLKPGKSPGQGTTSSLLQALNGALENRADIINLSLGSPQADPLLTKALERTAATGVIITAPAGNDQHQKKLAFPASAKPVISVAGLNDNQENMPNKQVAELADLRLPAQYVMVALPGNRISFMSGTSFASAEAAGLLAAWRINQEQVVSCRKSGDFLVCLEQ
ncbi:MAG: S8 family serine peptidase [Deltaproteobacteria bacterium]|nr:S8 family serine peptidase [Deltaproteobacteria bacterium]